MQVPLLALGDGAPVGLAACCSRAASAVFAPCCFSAAEFVACSAVEAAAAAAVREPRQSGRPVCVRKAGCTALHTLWYLTEGVGPATAAAAQHCQCKRSPPAPTCDFNSTSVTQASSCMRAFLWCVGHRRVACLSRVPAAAELSSACSFPLQHPLVVHTGGSRRVARQQGLPCVYSILCWQPARKHQRLCRVDVGRHPDRQAETRRTARQKVDGMGRLNATEM